MSHELIQVLGRPIYKKYLGCSTGFRIRGDSGDIVNFDENPTGFRVENDHVRWVVNPQGERVALIDNHPGEDSIFTLDGRDLGYRLNEKGSIAYYPGKDDILQEYITSALAD